VQLLIQKAGPQHQDMLENLYQLYLNDIGGFFEHIRLAADGRYPNTQLLRYFNETEREPWLVLADGNAAGFALLRDVNRNEEMSKSIDEFFVHQDYRRCGAGSAIANELLNHYPGRWEIGVVDVNERAIQFWLSVIQGRCGDNFHEHRNDGAWPGPLYMFSVS